MNEVCKPRGFPERERLFCILFVLNKKYAKVPDRERPKGGFAAEKIAAERQKDLIWFVRVCCLCALIRGLQNLESFERF